RSIPLKYKLDGKIKSLNISQIQVANEEFQVNTNDGQLIIKIGSPTRTVIGKKEYQITYTAENAILNFGDHQEFYWNVTGNESSVPINRVVYDVTFPRYFATSGDGVAVFTGSGGSQARNATFTQKSTTFSGST